MVIAVSFRRAPDDPRRGFVEVSVTSPGSPPMERVVLARSIEDPIASGRTDASEGVDPDDLVVRALAALATPSAGDEADRPGTAGQGDALREALDSRNRSTLLAAVDAMPHGPLSRLLVMAATLDALDGKHDVDYSRLLRHAHDPRRWDVLGRGLDPDRVPDGVYDVRWEDLPFGSGAGPRGRDGTARVYCLKAATGREYLLLSFEERGPGPERSLRVGGQTMHDTGSLGITHPPGVQGVARALLGEHRLLLIVPSIGAGGRAVVYRYRMLVATPPTSMGVLKVPSTRSAALEWAAQLIGMRWKAAARLHVGATSR